MCLPLQMENFICHLVLGIFLPQIHVFLGPMGKKMRSSENEDYIRYVVLIFGNSWTWWEHVHWERKTACISHFWIFVKTQKYGPFSGPKKCFWVVFFWFSSPELILAGETCQKPHSILSIWAPRALFVIYTPHIWSHHPVLDSHVQITRKYSTAKCLNNFP